MNAGTNHQSSSPNGIVPSIYRIITSTLGRSTSGLLILQRTLLKKFHNESHSSQYWCNFTNYFMFYLTCDYLCSLVPGNFTVSSLRIDLKESPTRNEKEIENIFSNRRSQSVALLTSHFSTQKRQ